MHITAKPTSFKCNLKCDYCFYLEKESFIESPSLMSRTMLSDYIEKYIDASGDEVFFTWQGGEPTLAGLEFFQEAVRLQQQFAKGKKIHNALQTNGVLLNDAWCQFFHDNHFLIGISIDGDQALHDSYRVTTAHKGSFHKVKAAIELLNQHNVEFNALTVVNNINVKQPLVVYNTLKSLGCKHIQFIELVETLECDDNHTPQWLGLQSKMIREGSSLIPISVVNEPGRVADFSVSAKEYGQFMATIFEQWVHNDVGTVFVRQFESLLSCFVGNGHTSCVFQESCGDNFVVEANGDIYECDHYVYPDYRLGNVAELTLSTMFGSKVNASKRLLASECKGCIYKAICNGGCPKHRFNQGRSYFCEGYKILFAAVTPYMNAMAVLIQEGVAVENIMKIAPRIRAL